MPNTNPPATSEYVLGTAQPCPSFSSCYHGYTAIYTCTSRRITPRALSTIRAQRRGAGVLTCLQKESQEGSESFYRKGVLACGQISLDNVGPLQWKGGIAPDSFARGLCENVAVTMQDTWDLCRCIAYSGKIVSKGSCERPFASVIQPDLIKHQ